MSRAPLPQAGTPFGRGSCRRTVLASLALVTAACLSPGGVGTAAADGPGEWFRTAEQRAAARLRAGDHEALAADAPDPRWEALGRYGAGDHDGAADAFARALESADALPASERDALRFGQATAQARAGRLDEALSLYDALLADDPDNVDAAHNRDIVQALRELGTPDEPERRQDGDGSGELPPDASSGGGGEGESASRESRESGQGGERQDEPQGSDRSAGAGEAVAAEANGGDSAGGDADGRDGSEPGESERARADRRSDGPGGERAAEDGADGESAAREALAAEAARARERDESGTAASEGEADGRAATANGAEAFDEGEQAVRQWLRRIPDDPAGLLRARLRQTHRDDYPEVGDGDEPW